MLDPAGYCAVEALRDGTRIEIRALKPDDRGDLLAAVNRASTQSLFRRFFAVRRHFTEKEIDFFTRVDFVTHVALVAAVEENGRATIVGGGRYIVVKPGEAELAFAVIDPYQGRGIGSMLLRHLIAIARAGGMRELIADVLPGNTAMLKAFERGGFRRKAAVQPDVVQVGLELG